MRNGYGVKKIPGKGDNSTINAHRYVYEKSTNKKIPKGMSIDHTCRNRRCINPKHMEIVTYGENKTRAWQAQRGEYKHKNYKGEVKKFALKQIINPNAKRAVTANSLNDKQERKKRMHPFDYHTPTLVKKFEVMPQEEKARSKRKKQYAAGAVAGAAAVPMVPTKIKVPGAENPDGLKTGKSKTKDLRGAVVGESFRFNNEGHTAQLAQKIKSDGGFDPKHPVTVGQYKDGKKTVIAGHHRIRAAEMLGVEDVPTRVVGVDRKSPAGVTPLYRRGKFRRDVKAARKTNPKLSSSELADLAAKKTGRLGRFYNDINGKLDVGAAINRVSSNPKVKVGAYSAAGAAGGVALSRNQDKIKEALKKSDDTRNANIVGLAATGGAGAGAGGYLATGYGLKRLNESRRNKPLTASQKKSIKAHKKAFEGQDYPKEFFRKYPKDMPGGRTQRALGWAYRGKTGRLGVQGVSVAVPALVAGYGAHKIINSEVKKAFDPAERIKAIDDQLSKLGEDSPKRDGLLQQRAKMEEFIEGTDTRADNHAPKKPKPEAPQAAPSSASPKAPQANAVARPSKALFRRKTLTVPAVMVAGAGATGFGASKMNHHRAS